MEPSYFTPLSFTGKHKTQLSEMCGLFHRYASCRVEGDSVLCVEDGLGKTEKFTVHWFEFCLKQLPIELFGAVARRKSTEDWTGDDIMFESWKHRRKFYDAMYNATLAVGGTHPIDYLYEQFQSHDLGS